MVVEILHDHFDAAQHEHVRGRQPDEAVHDQAEEVECAGRDFADALRQLLQVALGVGAEVDVRDEEAADEEEGVDAERPVRDGLEEELLLDHLAQLHVVRVLEDDDAGVAEDHPGHRERPQAVDGRNGVGADSPIADRFEVVHDREREQQLRPDA